MAVLSRAGCNSGACHGNLNGKGGFKLSLRGQDADFDFAALTRDTLARRLDPTRPAESLLLAKATMTVPHEGGQRFAGAAANTPSSAAGSPAAPASTRGPPAPAAPRASPGPRATGAAPTNAPSSCTTPSIGSRSPSRPTFSDGSPARRDRGWPASSRRTCSSGPTAAGVVQRVRFGETAVLVRYLDRQAVVSLAFVPGPAGVRLEGAGGRRTSSTGTSSPSCACSASSRPASAPTASSSAAPTSTRSASCRRRPRRGPSSPTRRPGQARGGWSSALVRRNEFADFWALKWSDLLRNEEKVLDARGVRAFHAWIRRAILDGKPLNEFARELIAVARQHLQPARGELLPRPARPVHAGRGDRPGLPRRPPAVRQVPQPPVRPWTQADYHRFAAFFPRVQYRICREQPAATSSTSTSSTASRSSTWTAPAS